MKTTIDYSKELTPKFSAVEDIKEYLGESYDAIAEIMKDVIDKKSFLFACNVMGIEGFPVGAWYEHFNGEESWKELDEQKEGAKK